MTAAELVERVEASINKCLGPIMVRPERMEQAIAGRKRLCEQLSRAAIAETLAAIQLLLLEPEMIDALADEIREGS